MQAVLADVILSFRLLKVGGFLIADDMKLFPEVEHAMAAVVEAFGGEGRLEVLHNEVRTTKHRECRCSPEERPVENFGTYRLVLS